MIDVDTLEIVRLLRDGVNVSYTTKSNGYIPSYTNRFVIFTDYEYDKVKINDHFISLPVVKTVKRFWENGRLNTLYRSRYSDYKNFSVESKIIFPTIEESLE